LKLRQSILNKVKLSGTVLDEKQIAMIDELIEKTREHAEALEMMQKVYGAFEGAINKAFGTVENSIIGLIRGTESLKDVMKKMMQAFIADLTTSIIKMLILDRLKKTILASAGGPFGTILGSIFGRQGGGAVSNNTPYLVGEKGPELFIPNSSGRVAPMDKAGFGAQTRQQTPIVVEQHINFTTGVQATVRSEVLNLLPQIQNSTIAAVQEARLRGGKFAESFGAR
jgi:phage-related minor tail protein